MEIVGIIRMMMRIMDSQDIEDLTLKIGDVEEEEAIEAVEEVEEEGGMILERTKDKIISENGVEEEGEEGEEMIIKMKIDRCLHSQPMNRIMP